MSRYATLLLLLKHMGYVNGRVQFQKLLFLLEKNYHINTGYDFIPFKFGPYCQVIQEDIHHLDDYGYIEHEEVEKAGGEILHRYQITDHGEQYLLENDFGDIYDQVIQDLCYDFQNYSLRQLVEYVYDNYPEYTAHSQIKEQFFHPKPKQEEFTSADTLLDCKPIITPSFAKWLDEEIKDTTCRMEVSTVPVEQRADEMNIDEIVIDMLDIAYEDIATKAQEVSTQIMLDNYSESGDINNKMYFILDILENLLSSVQERDIIGVYTEFANTKTNIQMLDELITLHKTSLKSELVRLLFEFIEDISFFLDSIDRIISL
ncbi:MAG: hypothetical protein H7647_03140 [Candidatus Heimdallarchaeota archaeon]|nr:hypothetical protein [Candidatus Heimdallarchaeota archaeon]MCK4253424.1 hypothetical protein [Candidatus Heimdallarchaeota archaeon]